MRTIQNQRKIVWLGVAGCIAVAWVAGPRGGAQADDERTADKAPIVALDKLLTIPDSVKIEVDRRGRATRSEWRARFVKAQAAVVEMKQHLEESLAKLTKLADGGSHWKVSAPGVQAEIDDTSPLNFGLKQQIRRDRECVKRAERELVDLEVQANLAGVPNEWWMEQ